MRASRISPLTARLIFPLTRSTSRRCRQRKGEAELTRELLQEAHDRLTPGGFLIASTDNPRDRWLHNEMRTLFARVSRREHAMGVVYQARKTGPLVRRRNFASEFAFRDAGRLIHVRTRPGVFSHRKVDPGARQLMAAMPINPGERILDIGCGSGVVSLAAACPDGGRDRTGHRLARSRGGMYGLGAGAMGSRTSR